MHTHFRWLTLNIINFWYVYRVVLLLPSEHKQRKERELVKEVWKQLWERKQAFSATMPSELSRLTPPTELQPSRFYINVRRRRQLTRGLTCQSCPVNLSHLNSRVRLLPNSLRDMLLAARMAWLTAVLIPGLGGACVDVLDMREGDWGGRVRLKWKGLKDRRRRSWKFAVLS